MPSQAQSQAHPTSEELAEMRHMYRVGHWNVADSVRCDVARLLDYIDHLKAQLTLMPCGHPKVCEEDGVCAWCHEALNLLNALELGECGHPQCCIKDGVCGWCRQVKAAGCLPPKDAAFIIKLNAQNIPDQEPKP